MKILVTGANGQLGHDVVKEAQKRGIEAVGATREMLDITNKEQVYTIIVNSDFDAVIHCAAWTAVDLAEDEIDKTYEVNVLGTKYIAEACEKKDIPMMYFSTDYVFDGNGDQSFKENDLAAPLNVYGETKYNGELEVKKLDKYFIIRISWVFGENGKNFIKTMLSLGKERGKVSVVNDQFGSPTYTSDLSRLVIDMIQTNKYGLYHATNQGYCSWYDFAVEIFKQANMDVEVTAVDSSAFPVKAKRPHNSRLGQENLDENGFERLPEWKDALQRYLSVINE